MEPEGTIIKNKANRVYAIKKINPVPTGIEEVDRLLVWHNPQMKSGIDIPGIYMLGGGPGTGKTLFALTLAKKACDNGALTIYITVEETTSELLKAASTIGMDLRKCLEDLNLAIVEYAPRRGLSDESPYIITSDMFKPEDEAGGLESALLEIVNKIIEEAGEFSYVVLIIDSLPALTSLDPKVDKRDLLRVLKSLTNITYSITRLITEREFAEEQYVSKGLVELHSIRTIDGLVRYLIIPKMRARPHYTGPVPFEITNEGLKIYLPDTEKYKELIEKIRDHF